MFNVGGGELMLIALVALLILGPDKLPDFARKSARVLGQLRSMSQGFQDEMRGVMNFDDTDTPQTSRGPRLVGPIEAGNGTAGESSAEAAPGSSTPADAGGAPQSGTSLGDQTGPPAAQPESGNDGNSSGTSAA